MSKRIKSGLGPVNTLPRRPEDVWCWTRAPERLESVKDLEAREMEDLMLDHDCLTAALSIFQMLEGEKRSTGSLSAQNNQGIAKSLEIYLLITWRTACCSRPCRFDFELRAQATRHSSYYFACT